MIYILSRLSSPNSVILRGDMIQQMPDGIVLSADMKKSFVGVYIPGTPAPTQAYANVRSMNAATNPPSVLHPYRYRIMNALVDGSVTTDLVAQAEAATGQILSTTLAAITGNMVDKGG